MVVFGRPADYAPHMAQPTIGFGIALIVLGLVAYFGTGMVSITALIPTFFGIVVTGLGALAMKDRFRKPALYVAIVIGILGFLGSISGVPRMVTYVSGGDVVRPAASIVQSIMALIMLAFVVMLVKSLIGARRRKVR